MKGTGGAVAYAIDPRLAYSLAGQEPIDID